MNQKSKFQIPTVHPIGDRSVHGRLNLPVDRQDKPFSIQRVSRTVHEQFDRSVEPIGLRMRGLGVGLGVYLDVYDTRASQIVLGCPSIILELNSTHNYHFHRVLTRFNH